MSYVYLLYSSSRDGYYVGYTKDLAARVATHQRDEGGWTRGKGPWHLRYYEAFTDDTAARRRELALKRKKRSGYYAWLIANGPGTTVG